MEILIPILFFFIIFFVVVFKILSGIRKFFFSKEGKEGKAATWKDFLKDLTDQLQQQMGTPKGDAEESRSAWKQLMGREIQVPPVEPPTAPAKPPQPPKAEKIRAPTAGTTPSPISETAVGKERPITVPPPVMREGRPLSAVQLRNAVAWSEILAKPVGLREKS